MQEALTHFRDLDRKIDADRIAFNAQHSSLKNRIDRLSETLAPLRDNKPERDKVSTEIRALKIERDKLKAPAFYSPLAVVEKFARSNPAAEPVPAPTVKVGAGQTPLASYNNAQEMTNRVLAEISRLATAPVNDPEAIARQVDAVAAPIRVINGRIVWPQTLLRSQNGTVINAPDTQAVVAWLNRDALIAAASKLAGQEGPAITPQEREASLVELYERFATALRLEAAAAMLAEKASQRVVRRRHVHPAVLLGVAAAPKVIFDWHTNRRGE
jgi:hypothetical protein